MTIGGWASQGPMVIVALVGLYTFPALRTMYGDSLPWTLAKTLTFLAVVLLVTLAGMTFLMATALLLA